MRVIRELLYFRPEDTSTDLDAALAFLNRVISRKSIVFLVSDFYSPKYLKSLRIANRKHDMVPVVVTDPREVEMPDVGFIELEDAESGEEILIDTGSADFRKMFFELGSADRRERDMVFKQLGIDAVEIHTHEDYVDPLVRFFRKRASMIR